jgi:hypothetical protein
MTLLDLSEKLDLLRHVVFWLYNLANLLRRGHARNPENNGPHLMVNIQVDRDQFVNGAALQAYLKHYGVRVGSWAASINSREWTIPVPAQQKDMAESLLRARAAGKPWRAWADVPGADDRGEIRSGSTQQTQRKKSKPRKGAMDWLNERM